MNVDCRSENDWDLSMIAAVTGARGLIGRYIVEDLLAAGWHVRVLSRQLEGWSEQPNVQVVVADINNQDALGKFIAGASAVFHCAAELHDESRMYEVNVLGTACLLQALREASTVKYFNYLSSAGVSGPSLAHVIDENSKCHPSTVYERTKYEAEKMVVDAGLDMKVCILRPANVFDADKPGLVNLPLHNTIKDRMLLFLRGNEGAHLIHAKDVAAAAIFCMHKEMSKVEIFLVSYDDDKRNTVAGVYRLFRSFSKGSKYCYFLSLPNSIPYIIRKIRLGNSLHGRVRFSEDKLRAFGFVFPLGLESSVRDVYEAHVVTSE